MSETIEELTIERWEEGELVIKQLEKKVLSRGAWTTILYLCEEMDPKTKAFKAPNARIVRYRKMRGKFTPQSKFNISNAKQAMEIAAILQQWFGGKVSDADSPDTEFCSED